jgi:HK97 family phage prohead protease
MRAPKIERKIEYFPILGGEIKATNDAKGITEGYLNYIGNIDFGDDRTMKGAFTKTLQDSYARKSQQGLDYLWPYLWNHDYSQLPPGGIFEANEDRKGLYIKTQFVLDIQSGRELYASFKAGTMKKQSMGYKAIQVDWVKEDGRSIRNLLEVAVMEGSAVVFPMNDLAQVDTVKHLRYKPSKRSFYMGNNMPQKPAKKDFNDRYRAQQIDDWMYADWYDLTTALKQSIQDLFASGDSPMQDLENIVLNDGDNSQGFLSALRVYVQEGIDLDYSNYLEEQDNNNIPSYGYMNNSDSPEAKKLSAASHTKLTKAVDGMAGHLKDMKSELARQRSASLQGYPLTMGADNPPQQKQDDVKPEDNATEEDDDDEVTRLNKKRAAAYDLASMLQFQNADRGI